STHRRRARLREVTLRSVAADRLPDLQLGQLADHAWPGEQPDDKRRGRGEYRTQRQVVENVKSANVLRQQLEQLQQHQCTPAACAASAPLRSAFTTRSMRMKREPFTSMVALDVAAACAAAINDSTSPQCSAPAPKPATDSRVASPRHNSVSMPALRAY